MKCLIYARVSRDSGYGRSVAEQVAECRAWADREGWDVVDVLDEEGSASRYARKSRDDWQRVMQAVVDGHIDGRKIDAVLTWEASRATRDLTVYAELRDACATARIKWGYSGTLHDLSKRDARFRTGLDLLIAEDEAARTSERVRRAIRANADSGKPHGKALWGYRRTYDAETKQLISVEEHPDQAPLVREIYERVLAGESLYAVANSFNARGVPTRRPVRKASRDGMGWITQAIRQILRNPAYAGLRVHQGEIVGDAQWPALVDRRTWDRAQALLDDPRRQMRTGTCTAAHLLSGIAVCGVCGGALRVGKQNYGSARDETGRRPSYKTYLCRGANGQAGFHVAMSVKNLDKLVSSVIVARLSRPDVLDALNATNEDDAVTATERQRILDAIDAERAWLDQVRERANRERNLDALFDQEARSKATIADLQTQLTRLSRRLDPAVTRLIAADDVGAAWEAAPLEEKRLVIRALMVPRLLRADPGTRGRRGLRPERLQIEWI